MVYNYFNLPKIYVNVIARVCSLHFDSSDYEKPLIQRMLEYSPKHQRKLKSNAVPSKNLIIYYFS